MTIQKKFNSFLKGLNRKDKPSDSQLVKLYSYIDNEMKAEFIADLFSKVLLSNSKISCVIMGRIVQTLVEKKKDISHNELVCVDALTKFFDYDINNLKLIFECIDNHIKKHHQSCRVYSRSLLKYCKEKGALNKQSLILTLEKAVFYQLLHKETDIDLDMDEDNIDSSNAETSEYYMMTSAGKMLYGLILDIIIEDLETF